MGMVEQFPNLRNNYSLLFDYPTMECLARALYEGDDQLERLQKSDVPGFKGDGKTPVTRVTSHCPLSRPVVFALGKPMKTCSKDVQGLRRQVQDVPSFCLQVLAVRELFEAFVSAAKGKARS